MEQTEELPSTKLPVRQYIKATWHRLPEHKAMLVLPLANVLTTIVMPLLASRILASLVSQQQHVWTDFAWFVTIAIVGTISNFFGIRACMVLQAKVMNDLQNRIFGRLIGRSAGFFANQIGGKLVSDALAYVQSYGIAFNVGYSTLFSFFLTTIIGLVIVIVSSPLLGLAITILLAALAIWTAHELKTRTLIRQARLEKSKKQVAHLSDSIVNAITVKTFAREDTERQTARQLSKDLMEARAYDWRRTVTAETQRMSMLLFIQATMVFLVILLTRHNPALLATSIFAFSFSINLLSRFFAINNAVRTLEDGLLEALPMAELLLETAEIKDMAGATELKVHKGAIELKNVHFAYPETDDSATVFDDLNLIINPGERVGLIGRSGGGKTTLTRLLLRFEDVQGGTITIDGHDIARVSQNSLRDQVAYVPQEPLLFHRSIGENIAYGKPDASNSAVQHAAGKAHADTFIDELPQGYATIVGERGVKLSGGQRQRVAIARAILKDAPILVLDEATSALDSESEKAIQAALWELMKEKTAIVIAHRLSTIQRLDRIIVMDKGTVVEDGTHQELLAEKGLYARLWEHQSGGFIQE